MARRCMITATRFLGFSKPGLARTVTPSLVMIPGLPFGCDRNWRTSDSGRAFLAPAGGRLCRDHHIAAAEIQLGSPAAQFADSPILPWPAEASASAPGSGGDQSPS